MARQTNQLLAQGLQNCIEVLEERYLSKDDKERLWSYVNKAIALTKPNYTYFQLTLWFNHEMTDDDTGEKYRANILFLNFDLRLGQEKTDDDFEGQCAFVLHDHGRIKTLVIVTGDEEEIVRERNDVS